MKKILKFISLCIALVLFVTGCSCNKDTDEKVALMYGDMNATSYREITETALNSKLERKENLLVYYYDSTCGGCLAFAPILNSVIQDKHLLVYAIAVTGLSSDSEIKQASYNTPTLLLYRNGELFKSFQSTNEKYKDYFASKDGLESFLDEYTYLPTAYFINKETLASKVNSGDKFIIYFFRSNCGDCKSIDDGYFHDYLKTHVDGKKIYVFDKDVDMDLANDSSAWQTFKDMYGLSKEGSSEFGYNIGTSRGVVPTFQYREGNEIKDAVVLFNTLKSYNPATQGVPYFDDDDPENTTYESYAKYKETRLDFYASKLETFLNNNLTKVD